MVRSGWDSLMVRAAYKGRGWSDPGEQHAFAMLGDLIPRARVLDLGVGGGRTTAILASNAVSYTGIDLSPAMVATASARHPGVDIRVGDAGDLGAFRDGSFDLIVFSHNGVDCLSHDARALFFQSCQRLLSPGGALLVSSHNLDGPSFAEVPSTADMKARWAKPGLMPKVEVVVVGPLRLALAIVNYHRTGPQTRREATWGVAPLRAHEFRFVVHFERFGVLVDEVQKAGLTVEKAWTNRGQEVDVHADRHTDDYVHLVCRRT